MDRGVVGKDDWLDEDEYPSDEDIAKFGDDSPYDNDRLTIGRVDGLNPSFWTRRRIILLMGVLILLGALLLPSLLKFV